MKTVPRQRIECWKCGKHPYIINGHIEPHTYTRVHYAETTAGWTVDYTKEVACPWSWKPYPSHTSLVVVAVREDIHGRVTGWGALCDCGSSWVGDTADDVITQSSMHTQEMERQAAMEAAALNNAVELARHAVRANA